MIRLRAVSLTSLFSMVFFFSGFAGLVYQVVWQRLLTVNYGVATISITLIVSVYMFGLGLGSLVGGHLADKAQNRVRLYFVVELLLGVFGLMSLPFMAFLGKHTAGSDYTLTLVYLFLFLSVPTFLMGITLPLLTKIFNSLVRDFLRSVSFLYFINTLGAALGALAASYVLISFFGLDVAVYVGVSINFVLAGVIFFAGSRTDEVGPTEPARTIEDPPDPAFARRAALVVFVTGFAAIAYEIVWFRIVGLLVKSSPYAFSSILAVYLFGIALGSYGMSRYVAAKPRLDKKSLFFGLQFLIGLYVLGASAGYYYLTKYTVVGELTTASFASVLHPRFELPAAWSFAEVLRHMYWLLDVFVWSAYFVLIPTILMGASFPLISWLALTDSAKEGRTVGTVYFLNILGNVAGGLMTGFVLLPVWGTEVTLLVLSLTGVLFGLLTVEAVGRRLSLFVRAAAVSCVVAIGVLVFPGKGQLYETMHKVGLAPYSLAGVWDKYYGVDRPLANYREWLKRREPTDPMRVFHLEEGIDGVVVTASWKGRLGCWINGLAEGGRPGYIFYNKTVETVRFAGDSRKVLLIGFGTGSVADAIRRDPQVTEVVVVELNRTLIRNLTKMKSFREILADPKVRLVIEDGRRYLHRTRDTFDLIMMDPIRSTTAYSNNIYSREFFELAKTRLGDAGVLYVWTDEYRSLPKTVADVFEHVRWYSGFCLGSAAPFTQNDRRSEDLLANLAPAHQAAYHRIGHTRYLGDRDDLSRTTARFPSNRDWRPVCEYYLGNKLRKMRLGI
ncbi:MAG: fused MFS/spermidine synthase [Thermodesulfobacteriota bacterium]